MSSNGNALRIKQSDAPRHEAERGRLRVLHGPDKGITFILTGKKATIGRGENADVILRDNKSSRIHAEIYQTGAGWVLKDTGSSNGFSVNGQPTKEHVLSPNDVVGIGETILEFLTADLPTQILQSKPRSPEEIKKDIHSLEDQRQKVRAMGGMGGSPSSARGGLASRSTVPKKKNYMPVFVIAGLAVAALTFFEEKLPVKGAGTTEDPKTISQAQIPTLKSTDSGTASGVLPFDEKVMKVVDAHFKSGFREYREGNYLRARQQFDLVLQVNPNHRLARLYIEKSNKSIDREVRKNLEAGKKSLELGRLKDAKGRYETVLRLLHHNPTNPGYLVAKEQLQKALDEMKKAREIRP